MRSVFRLLAGVFALALPLQAAPNRYAELAGNYTGSATVETTSLATGTVTLTINPLRKGSDRAAIRIEGSLSPTNTTPGTGNSTPMRATLALRGPRVTATNFLLGLRAERMPSRPAHVHGSHHAFRFTLGSADDAGRLRCSLKIRKGVLTLTGVGFYQPAGAEPQRIRIVIAANPA